MYSRIHMAGTQVNGYHNTEGGADAKAVIW